MVRYPAAIGFYPGDKNELINLIKWLFSHPYGPGKEPKVEAHGKKELFGVISPHAGYIFSGPIAAHSFYKLAEDGLRKRVILFGPSHGYPVPGAAVADKKEKWMVPLGDVNVDADFITALLKEKNDAIMESGLVHVHEHSLEVQLPFLQYLFKDKFSIVPVLFGSVSFSTIQRISRTFVDVLKSFDLSDTIFVISSDFTHYGSGYGYAPAGTRPVSNVLKWMYNHDGEAIKQITNLDAEAFFDYVTKNHMTICGYVGITTAILIAKEFNIQGGKLLKYATSWDTNEDYRSEDHIVGYASIALNF